VNAWLGWAPTAPDELDANLRLSTSGDPDRSPVVNLFGAMLGTESDTTPLLSGFVDLVGADPSTEFQRSMPHRDVKRHLSGLGATETEPDQPEQRSMFSKSEFFQRPLPQQAITAVLDHLAEGLGAGQSRDLRFTPWGGAYNRVRSDATAFVHRDEMVMVEHVVTSSPQRQAWSWPRHAAGWTDRGRRCIRGDHGVCIRTFLTPTSRTGRMRTTAPTMTDCSGRRGCTTPPTGFAFRSRCSARAAIESREHHDTRPNALAPGTDDEGNRDD